MRAVLHIGTEKTGSSSLQAYLSRGAGELARSGVHCCSSAGHGNNRALAAAFMDPGESDDYTRLHGLDDEAARASWRAAFLEAFAAEVGGDGFIKRHFITAIADFFYVHFFGYGYFVKFVEFFATIGKR